MLPFPTRYRKLARVQHVQFLASPGGREMSRSQKPMSNEERLKLIEKLNADLEDYVAERSKAAREKKAAQPADTRTVDEIFEELKSHPAFMKDIDWSKPLPPDIEGLMQLKYESEDPTARAGSYKDEGNEQFKLKKYSIAVANYTEGIKSKSPDPEINAVLYANRAAAQFHLGNYRSSLNDCVISRKFKPDHKKAIVRGAQCCFEMKKFDDVLRWCDAALMIDPEDPVIVQLQMKTYKEKTIQERNRRKQSAQERKVEEEDQKLLMSIQKRGICISNGKSTNLAALEITSVESHNPAGAKVYLDEQGVLHWPVLFFYPEYAETDFISSFSEHDCFYDHLAHMFGPESEQASWDTEHKYKVNNLEVYFEDKDEEKLYQVSANSTLLEALQHKKYIVYGGTPGFIVLVNNSKFKQEFLKKYKHHS